MKKNYIAPSIRVKAIEVESQILAASGEKTDKPMGFGGDSGSGVTGDAKFHSFGSDDTSSSINWDDEE